jgi:hypothetical protein
VLHAVKLVVPLAKAHVAPPIPAGVVTVNVWELKPPLHVALQAVGVLQLPTQSTGQACRTTAQMSNV